MHSESARQPAAQVCEAVQYSPVGQSPSAMQVTQVFSSVLQNGVVPPQSFVSVHCTHTALELPLVPRQMGVPVAHAVPELPQTQVPFAHRLLSSVHSESARQPGAQMLLLVQYSPAKQSVF